MNERDLLLQTIATLEAHRAELGDEVVNLALAPLKERLASLELPSLGERKLVTVLFADLVGFTSMAEKMDPEDVREILNLYFSRWEACIQEYGGRVEKFIGDAVMAVFGLEAVHESDPENALQAAVQMVQDLERINTELEGTHRLRLAMRVGIHTGPAVVSLLGESRKRSDGQDFVVIGDTVNTASRLEQTAPANQILISQETYRHVRGIFSVLEQAPIKVKGKLEPLQTYIVLGAKPRAFRFGIHGIEGLETRTVGREGELRQLQEIYQRAAATGKVQVITLTGEAGVGKSRLLFEFNNWIELLPDEIWYFRGRAGQHMEGVAYALLRDILSTRFEIQDSDTAVAAQDKLVAGITEFIGPQNVDKAHFIGQLIGMDFSSSPSLSPILSDSRQIHDRAFYYLAQFFQAMSGKTWTPGVQNIPGNPLTPGVQPTPVVLLLEDIQWADDGSLDWIERLAEECTELPMLILCLARPTLFERRPAWGRDQACHTRIDLALLTPADSQRLVDELLRKVEAPPQELRELILSAAEGNPFFMEEMVRMLIDDGVILPSPGPWRVVVDRLGTVKLPQTLTGVLQARLDSLPPQEKTALQRAAVIGRIFWDGAVAFLGDGPPAEPVLRDLSAHELIYKRESSSFAGVGEYMFKHNILQEVTYESILKKQRRDDHQKVAEWLVKQSGERINEYTGLIASHYEKAGEPTLAVEYLRLAAERALQTGASREATSLLDRALAWLPETSAGQAHLAEQVYLLRLSGEAYWKTGHYAEAIARLQKCLETIPTGGEAAANSSLQVQVQLNLSQIAYEQGRFKEARSYIEASLALARQVGDCRLLSMALYQMGFIYAQEGEVEQGERYLSESLALAQEEGDRMNMASALNGLGVAAQIRGDYELASAYIQRCLAIAQEMGDQRRLASSVGNLGFMEMMSKNYTAALPYLLEAVQRYTEIGSPFGMTVMETNLGHTYQGLGDLASARQAFTRAIRRSLQHHAVYNTLEAVAGLAEITALEGNPEQGAEWLAVVINYPLSQEDTRRILMNIQSRMEANLGAQALREGLERSRSKDLESVALEILGE